MVGEGTAVNIGSPIAEWLDCSVKLVDVPASDIEWRWSGREWRPRWCSRARIGHGRPPSCSPAARPAPWGWTPSQPWRRAAPPVGVKVLLRLEPTPEDIAACPIGLSAFVEFPQVDPIDMLRARLRL